MTAASGVQSLCLSKRRFEHKALHFEVRNPRVSPRRTRDDALRTADIDRNSGQHRSVKGRVMRPAVAGIAAVRRLRRDAVVAVMQIADFWNGDDATGCGYRKVDPRQILRVLSELVDPVSPPRSVQITHEQLDVYGKEL